MLDVDKETTQSQHHFKDKACSGTSNAKKGPEKLYVHDQFILRQIEISIFAWHFQFIDGLPHHSDEAKREAKKNYYPR